MNKFGGAMRKYPIQSTLKFLHELHNSYIEMEDGALLEKCEYSKIKAAIAIPDAKWNNRILFSSWEIIEKYREHFEENDYDITDVEKPDYDESLLKKNCLYTDVLTLENKNLYIKNVSECMKESFNIIENCNCSTDFKFDLTLENIYKIVPFILENKLTIEREALFKINYFLNDLEEVQMSKGLPFLFKKDPKPFQEIGILFALINKKVIIGDEMGLGKSLQAIITVDITKAYPCLIVCPSSLKYNWRGEIDEATDQESHFLNGKNPVNKNFYIINYESLHKHLDFIKTLGLKSIIFDESHYLKNEEAKRTQNSLEVVKNIEYRLELTGTPVLKVPLDLVSQLKLINKLEFFGGKDKFLESYCSPAKTTFGTDYNGASNLESLSRALREICFIRRTKKDVLKELPEKTRTKILVDIPNIAEYKRTLNDFLSLDKKNKLRKIEDFRQSVAEYKISLIKEIIDDFLDNNQKIVVFAYHRSIQNRLIELYPDACKIVSEEPSAQDINKKIFQEDENKRIIICSFRVANMGFDLTAASNVIFAEMDWCPALNNQAEDRCHRIGQESSVNAWYIIAKDTIEEHIWNVSERKREIIEKIYSKSKENKDEDNICKLYDSIIEEVIDLL